MGMKEEDIEGLHGGDKRITDSWRQQMIQGENNYKKQMKRGGLQLLFHFLKSLP
jgi:hypothetical protein